MEETQDVQVTKDLKAGFEPMNPEANSPIICGIETILQD